MHIYVACCTRMVVAEVVPSAWPLATFVPSTFNLYADMHMIYYLVQAKETINQHAFF